jgi:short chain dehydrogenase
MATTSRHATPAAELQDKQAEKCDITSIVFLFHIFVHTLFFFLSFFLLLIVIIIINLLLFFELYLFLLCLPTLTNMLCTVLFYLLAGGAAISVGSYLLLYVLDAFVFCDQNLKRKYSAEWAVVTGASGGIGRAIVEKLADQDINVVMVALDDDLMNKTHKEMEDQYPNLEFRKVGVNLGAPGYLEVISKACSDIKPNLIFNNAGFVMTGVCFFVLLLCCLFAHDRIA